MREAGASSRPWSPPSAPRVRLSAAPTAWKLEPRHLKARWTTDRKSTRLNSSHQIISYAVFCLKKKKSTAADSVATGLSTDTAIEGTATVSRLLLWHATTVLQTGCQIRD